MATQGQGAYGGIPQLPSPVSSAGTAIAGNQANLAAILSLAGGVDRFNTGQSMDTLKTFIPGYESISRGILPQDAMDQLAREGAERGFGSGTSSSAEYLKALGLNSLDLISRAAQIAVPYQPQQFDPSSLFVSPGAEQDARASQAILNAAPNPTLQAQQARRDAQNAIQQGLNTQAPVHSVSAPSGASIPVPGSRSTTGPASYPTLVANSLASSTLPWPGQPSENDYKAWSSWINSLPITGTNANWQAEADYWNPDNWDNGSDFYTDEG